MVAIHNGALYLINNLENFVVFFLGLKVVFNHNQTKYKGTFLNRALTSLHKGLLEITFTSYSPFKVVFVQEKNRLIRKRHQLPVIQYSSNE